MPRPALLLLDVDGVLNALGRPLPQQPTYRTGRASGMDRTFEIAWAPEVVARLVALHTDGLAEVRWLTTWGHDANASLRRLIAMPDLAVAGTYDDADRQDDAGLPEDADPGAATGPQPGSLAAVTPAARDGLTGRWWKFDVVRSLIAEDPERRLVWLDDDLEQEPDLAAWTRRQTDALVLSPDPLTGLTPDDLDRVEAFCRLSPGE